MPTVGQQDPERLAALAGGQIANLRLFTMGVGHDVNTWLLDGSKAWEGVGKLVAYYYDINNKDAAAF